MSALATLKLVVGKKIRVVSPVIAKREKMIAKLAEQIAACEAQIAGTKYEPTRQKKVLNLATGEREVVTSVKRVREWFWLADNGKLNIAVKYGAKTLALNKKGANAIEVADEAELLKTLQLIMSAVVDGEFDELIAEAASATRKGFGK